MKQSSSNSPIVGLFVAVFLILGGGFWANDIQTSGGIEVKDLRFLGSDGKMISAFLYIPPKVNKSNPVPGIVAFHGYTHSREEMSPFAIEFSRRGYVVLTPDLTGHGFSDPPAFANVFGGVDALSYLRSLDIVDKDSVGLMGIDMGGWAALFAADIIPDGYQSVFLVTSSTGSFGVPEGSIDFPHNLAVVAPKFDEFSNTLWESPNGANVPDSSKLKTVFGVNETIRANKLYGSYHDRTARILFQPDTLHLQAGFSTKVVAHAIDWMQSTLKGGQFIEPENQIWYFKEIGTLASLLGMIWLIFAQGKWLLSTDLFVELKETHLPSKGLKGILWWINAGVLITLPAGLYLFFWQVAGDQGVFKASYVWPQQLTSTLAVWLFFTSVIILGGFFLWHFLFNLKNDTASNNYGLTWQGAAMKGFDLSKIYKSLLLSLIILLTAYLTLMIFDGVFNTNFRVWFFSINLMSKRHMAILIRYIFFPMSYFFIIGLVLHGQMRSAAPDGNPQKMWKDLLINSILLVGPLVVVILIQYADFFSEGTLRFVDLNLATILLCKLIPFWLVAAGISTYFYRKTGHIYVGSFINGFFISWVLVASQPIHYA